MKRSIIVIGGGSLQLPLIKTAASMGLKTFVFDMSRDAPGMTHAYAPVIMSTRDIDGCVREAKKLRQQSAIHGVITAGTDASRAVAAIAAALDLPGIRYGDAEAASNKVLMRKRLQRHGIPIPAFAPIWSIKDARDAMDELTFPLVLKPAENMGARGVIKISKREEIYAAYKHSKKYSTTGEMILEEYMPGPELSVDALAWGEGKIRITGIADRIIAREPYFIELGHNMPSCLDRVILEEAETVMMNAMRAIGIHTGASKGDLKVTPDGVKVGEIAARLSGGFMSSHTYPMHSGVNILRAAIQIALGQEPDDLEPNRNLVCIERGILSAPGKILDISGVDEASQVKNIQHVFLSKKPGDILNEATSNIDKVGHVIALADTLHEAEASANEALSKMHVYVDDTFSVNWKEIEERARVKFGESVCWVCKQCDGTNCASGVPGMGGIGKMSSFADNSRALSEWKIIPRYIRDAVSPDCSIEIFGIKLEMPILAAPMTGALTNMRGAITEFDFARILLNASREAGTVAMAGDGASPEKYKTIFQALSDTGGHGIAIFKPRADTDELMRRIKEAEKIPLLAVGMDIDAIQIRTMEMKGLRGEARNFEAIRMIRDSTRLPFVLKGIMSPEDAEECIRAGVDAIIVSNHGGRVLDDMPGTARVLPDIAEAVKGKITILVDGGVRSGQDVFKMLSLGADAVLVGRPLAIAAVGGDQPAVKYLLGRYREELIQCMNLCGTELLKDINNKYIIRTNDAFPDKKFIQ